MMMKEEQAEPLGSKQTETVPVKHVGEYEDTQGCHHYDGHNSLKHRLEPFSLSHVAALADRAWLQKLIYRLFSLDKLDQLYKTLPRTNSTQAFVQAIFAQQNISYSINRHTDQKLTDKPLIVVANHPFGMIEGLILLDFLLENRSDVKLMANKFVQKIPELAEVLLGVLPFSDKAAIIDNRDSIRRTVNWLSEGHCLACFPAGNVSRFQFPTFTIEDDVWTNQVIRLARSTQANILPVYFEGRNSLAFYLFGLLGPKMHSLLYGREFLRKEGASIKMHVGEIIPPTAFKSLETESAVALIRSHVYGLDSGLA